MFLLIAGLMMGGSIWFTDVLLRPRLGQGIGEVVRFAVEGMVVYGVYRYAKMNLPGAPSTCDDECQAKWSATQTTLTTKTLAKSMLAAFTIWVSDLFIRPEFFTGLGREVFKYGLQGFIVLFVLNMANDMNKY